MRHLTTIVLSALLLIGVAPSAQAKIHDGPHRWMSKQCRYQDSYRPTWTPAEVMLTIRCAEAKFHMGWAAGEISYIAHRESGPRLYYAARNPYSGACGIFQMMPLYWPGREGAFDRVHPLLRLNESCTNARSNVLVALWMMRSGGFGPWS